MSDEAKIAIIAGSLSEAQRKALLSAWWIHPGGMDPIALVDFTDAWPEGLAQFCTMCTDRLTPLGLAVKAYLEAKGSTV